MAVSGWLAGCVGRRVGGWVGGWLAGSLVAASGGVGLLPFKQHKQQLFVSHRRINQCYHLVFAHLLSSFPRLFAWRRELVYLFRLS